MESRVMPGFQVMSDLLTTREKNVICSLMPPKCTLMKSTVAQVLESSEEHGALVWRSAACGVLCAVRDDLVNSYFFRLFCVKRAELLWEHEVYVPFSYTVSRTYFHTFPADGRQAGFNFADETEAEEFHFAVEVIKDNQEKKSTSSQSPHTSEKHNQPVKPERRTSWPEVSPTSTTSAFDLLKDSELDVFLRRLLYRSSLTEEDLRRRSVTEIVDHIIAQSGGQQAVQRELYTRGSGAMTLPRSASSALARKKGPPPQIPSNTPIKRTAAFSVPGVGDAILLALKEVYRQKELQQRQENESEN